MDELIKFFSVVLASMLTIISICYTLYKLYVAKNQVAGCRREEHSNSINILKEQMTQRQKDYDYLKETISEVKNDIKSVWEVVNKILLKLG